MTREWRKGGYGFPRDFNYIENNGNIKAFVRDEQSHWLAYIYSGDREVICRTEVEAKAVVEAIVAMNR